MKPIRIELPTQFPVGPVNAYLFVDPEPVLIDTGVRSDESWAALEAGMLAQGVKMADLSRVIITHPHTDHCGQAADIVAASGAEVWVSDLGKDWVVDFPGMWQKRIDFYREIFLPQIGYPPEMTQGIVRYFESVRDTFDSVAAEHVHSFAVDAVLSLGGLDWQVMYLPGHANHQTCFYQAETKQFISADHLLHKTPTPIVERPLTGSVRVPSLPTFLESLDVVEPLDIETVYPGHGELIYDHHALIQKQRGRIEKRKLECLALVESGHHTMAEMVNVMYAYLPPQARFSGLWMLVGYLDLLVAEGLVEERPSEKVLYFYKK